MVAESALELVPKSLWKDPSVSRDAERRGVDPGRILLDRSVHHSAMLRLEDGYRRGRPDLVHLTLLSVTSTPLHQEGKARVHIHTFGDSVLEFAEGARPPKSYARFRNLMEKMLMERPQDGLVKVRDADLPSLLRSTEAGLSVGLSVQGAPMTFESLADEMVSKDSSVVVVGGFPRGHFLPKDLRAFDHLARIHEKPLDAHVVAARVVYEVEKRLTKVGRDQR